MSIGAEGTVSISKYILVVSTRWNEQGERNNKYFFRAIKERTTQQTIQTLKCSATGRILHTATDILREAQSFYGKLYCPDPINEAATQSLLSAIPEDIALDTSQCKRLCEDLTLNTVFFFFFF